MISGLVVGSQIGLFVVSSMGAKHAAFHSEDETQKAAAAVWAASWWLLGTRVATLILTYSFFARLGKRTKMCFWDALLFV